MKLGGTAKRMPTESLSVPSTSGLRDETARPQLVSQSQCTFQYPQPRVYAMKREPAPAPVPSGSSFSTLNLGSTR